jgi:hypothetical protein
MQLFELRISFLTKKFDPLDILSWWLLWASRLSNAKLNVTRLHELGYAIREEALSLQYIVGYEEKMEDGDRDILALFTIKVGEDTTLTQPVAVRQVRER